MPRPPDKERGPDKGAPSKIASDHTGSPQASRPVGHSAACHCTCWHCTIGPAVDTAIVTGEHVHLPSGHVVVPDVEILELAANGIEITDYAGSRATHRAGDRACWILTETAS
ncbi:MAG: hypothetical protein ACRD0V_04330 [Acidimicrobiales bacterium]